MQCTCFICGQKFEVSGRAWRKRFCSPVCTRKSWKREFKRKHGVMPDALRRRRKRVRELKPEVRGVRLKGGVTQADYKKLKNAHWRATITVRGHTKFRWFSTRRYGEAGAHLAAVLQRILWLIEERIFLPDNGDPMAILGYTELLRGNKDYNESVVEADSPYLQKREE